MVWVAVLFVDEVVVGLKQPQFVWTTTWQKAWLPWEMINFLKVLEASQSMGFDVWSSPHQIKVWTVGVNLWREEKNKWKIF